MLKLSIKAHALFIAVFITGQAVAGVRHYVAPVEQSTWQLDPSSTPLQCALTHNVRNIGEARFVSKASKSLNLEFTLDMLMLPDTYAQAAVYSMPPKWMPGESSRLLSHMELQQQFDPSLHKKLSWTLLTELEKGFWPTFTYQDWYNSQDIVKVSLHSANFRPAYQDFVGCVAELLPFSLSDIAFTVLSYEYKSEQLTPYSQKRLHMIADYLRYDTELSLVLVAGHNEPTAEFTQNETLAQARAEQIQSFFTAQGIPAGRIEVSAFGEKRNIAPDTRTSTGLNRRVVIQMNKAVNL